MLSYLLVTLILILSVNLGTSNKCVENNEKPNIIIIMADDLGWNDVSYNGMNQFLTKNIDSLAYHGITIKKMYTAAMCAPSRASLLTGKYPIRTGMQFFVPRHDDPWGLCANETLMSHIFKNCGYSTNLIGKWHLGHFKKSYLPKLRGFDYSYGYLGGYTDYYDYSVFLKDRNYSRGLDFIENLEHNFNDNGIYLTDLLTEKAVNLIKNHNKIKPLFLMLNQIAPHTGNEDDPMQAPIDVINKFNYIKNEKRRIYAAMVNQLDESVGKVIQALKDNNMLCNSIVLFYSDNGAPTIGLHSNSGSNYPFKGMKNSPWEGGVRVPFVLFSPKLKIDSYNYPHPMHITDVLPTLASATQCKLPNNFQLDGIDHWNALSFGKTFSPLIPNRKILHNLDEITPYTSYLYGKWKYINGTTVGGLFDNWLGKINTELHPESNNYTMAIQNSLVTKTLESLKCQNGKRFILTRSKIQYLRGRNEISCDRNSNINFTPKHKCEPLKNSCLFDIEKDPCEKYNLAKDNPLLIKIIEKELSELRKELIPSVFKLSDQLSNPELHNKTWNWWLSDSITDYDMPGTYCVAIK